MDLEAKRINADDFFLKMLDTNLMTAQGFLITREFDKAVACFHRVWQIIRSEIIKLERDDTLQKMDRLFQELQLLCQPDTTPNPMVHRNREIARLNDLEQQLANAEFLIYGALQRVGIWLQTDPGNDIQIQLLRRDA